MTVARARAGGALVPWVVAILVGIVWGGSHLVAKAATATGHDPMGISVVTAAIAATLATGALLARGGRLPTGRCALAFYLACGFLGTALPNTLYYVIIARLPVGIVSILTAAVPMMTMVLGWAAGMERPGPLRILGLLLGGASVVLLVLPDAVLPGRDQTLWVVLGLAVALSYAAENVVIGTATPRGADTLAIMTGLSWGALVLLIPVVAIRGTWVDVTPMGDAEIAILALGVLHVGCYSGFVWLIGRAGAVFAAQVGYVVTVAGVAWGMVLLGERHSGGLWLALALMLAGMALVHPKERVTPEPPAKASP